MVSRGGVAMGGKRGDRVQCLAVVAAIRLEYGRQSGPVKLVGT